MKTGVYIKGFNIIGEGLHYGAAIIGQEPDPDD